MQLLPINQYNTDKPNLEEKNGGFDNNTRPFQTQKLMKLRTKYQILASGLVNTTALNIKTSEVENKIPNHDKYITTPEFNKLAAENFTARLK